MDFLATESSGETAGNNDSRNLFWNSILDSSAATAPAPSSSSSAFDAFPTVGQTYAAQAPAAVAAVQQPQQQQQLYTSTVMSNNTATIHPTQAAAGAVHPQYVQQQQQPIAVTPQPLQQPAPLYAPPPAPAAATATIQPQQQQQQAVVQQMPDGTFALVSQAAGVQAQQQQTFSYPVAAAAPPPAVLSAPPPPPSLIAPAAASKKKLPSLQGMTPQERQRYERNLREQQRSLFISQQIKELRSVLIAANIPLNSNKYSILLAAGEYIKQLQARAIMNEAEHHKLTTTLQKTNEMIQNPNQNALLVETMETNDGEDGLFVKGLDYRAVVQQCTPGALGVAALDGRFLECNLEFETISGISREELKTQTLFNLLSNQQEVFEELGEMLKQASMTNNDDVLERKMPLYCKGKVAGGVNPNLDMNITLARTADGKPRFFNCALIAAT